MALGVHSPEQDRFKRYLSALLIAISLFLIQLTVLFSQDSVTLLGDVVHTASDTLVIFGATWVAHKGARQQKIHHATEHWLTLFAIVTLLLGALFVFVEAYDHWRHPVGYVGWMLLIPAVSGMIGNWIAHRHLGGVHEAFHSHLHESTTEHFFQDFIVSAAVLCAALVNIVWGTTWIDAPLGALVGSFLLYRSWKLLAEYRETNTPHRH